jgi:hypothetical protein
MNRSHIKWICGAIAALLAVVASAEPPTHKFNNRTYGNSVGAGSCSDFEGGYRCRSIDVWQNYDVKGAYENTEATYQTEGHQWDPDDGSYEDRWRYITCPVDEKSIAANPGRVKLDLVLDTEAPGCYQWGERYGWNPNDGYYWEPYGFWGTWVIAGEWLDPFNYGSSMWNAKDKFYDGWSGTTFNGVHHCKSEWGDLMTRGGFSRTAPSGRTFFHPFEGPDGPAWSHYYISSCNDNELQK